jgi:hypothetical protein
LKTAKIPSSGTSPHARGLVIYGSLETTIDEGLNQTRGYMDKCGTKEGYLLIFNRSPQVSWEEKNKGRGK